MVKEFDLNIEKLLENWEVYHAVREIIANALDEQKLTGTKDISIHKENGIWHSERCVCISDAVEQRIEALKSYVNQKSIKTVREFAQQYRKSEINHDHEKEN